MSEQTPAPPNYDFILLWMERAEANCRTSGRNDAATLWGDAIHAIRYLRKENEVKRLAEAIAKHIQNGGGPSYGWGDDLQKVETALKSAGGIQ